MVFSSLVFLCIFLPIVFLGHTILPGIRAKNAMLLLASLVFYAYGEPVYVVLMVASALCNYLFALWIERFQDQKKWIVSVAVILNLALLVIFKYAGFLTESVNTMFGTGFPVPDIRLPIGISFFTFQAMSYVIDVYRGANKAQKNFGKVLLYISFFPQLIAGPIVKYRDIAAQITGRKETIRKFAAGIMRFCWGLGKKVLLANSFARVVDEIFKYGPYAVSRKALWLGAILYMMQIYYDFSGYSDMAIGLGRIFGFRFSENFDYPYISASITEFWRRWHKSLGSWFRDYVYIPLGGNRVSNAKWLRNILVVWLLTGLWHGASWNFVLWGLGFAVLLVAEKLLYKRQLERTHVVKRVYVLLLVTLSFVMFNAGSVKEAFSQLGAMFGAGGLPLVSAESLYYAKSYAVTFLIAVIGATPLCKNVVSKLAETARGAQVLAILQPVWLVLLLAACTAFLVDGSFNPFLYFRF